MIYKTFLVANLITLATALVFFALGLADGSVSAFNLLLWVTVLVFLVATVFVGRYLKSTGKARLASVVLGIVAIPTTLALFLMLVVLLAQPRWN